MIRYSTTDYPANLTDWTLAVEETTRNQYESTPYSLTGVLDETTYYFTAFALDSNNSIIDTETATITTDFGWKPWANTIAYYPLNSTYNFTDNSWNWYDLTVSNASITTLDWVSCASYSVGRAYNSTPSVWTKRTLSAWFYAQTSWVLIGTWANQNTFQCMMLSNAWTWKIQISDFHTIWYASNISSNEWHHAVAVCDGADMYLYIDWVLANSWTHTQTDNSTWVSAWGKPFSDANPDNYTWYLSKVIIENTVRTAQEIANYYNQTKANYWIS